MVHEVIEKVDAGAVVLVKIIDILDTDTIETFEEKVHVAEHLIIVDAVKLLMDS